MDENKINTLIQQGIQTYMNNRQFNISKIPNHTHNGTDTNKINEKDLIIGNKYTAFLEATAVNETNIIKLPNISSIRFYGFCANNLSGTPTVRAILNGEAQFGTSSQFGDTGQVTIIPVSSGIIESSNSMTIDVNAITNTRVSSTNQAFAYAVDSSGSSICQMNITSWSSSSVTITVTSLRSNFYIKGALIVT